MFCMQLNNLSGKIKPHSTCSLQAVCRDIQKQMSDYHRSNLGIIREGKV